ncbi:MAG: glycerol-3-phosphate 1-O-acyltransferase PlsY [Gammaproteobacteria bacterium]|nr:glycerol-3-phosphate 1-O-acyltransferase PlsY [Gammaproteobacteria bacterium]
MMISIALCLLAYFFGSLSSAIILCRLSGLPDPRTQGSGNPGATNVLRFGGKRLAAQVLLSDTLKGLLPVLFAAWIDGTTSVLAAVALCAFLGHLYPVFFGFQGGKGVATGLGVILGLMWPIGLALIATWIIVAAISRISSLGALVAAVAAPFYAWTLSEHNQYVILTIIISILLIWRHRSNIQKLFAGTENKVDSSA